MSNKSVEQIIRELDISIKLVAMSQKLLFADAALRHALRCQKDILTLMSELSLLNIGKPLDNDQEKL